MSCEVLLPIKVQRAIEALSTESGSCSPALRQAVQAYAARLSGGDREASPIPEELVGYVDKVTLHAYQITDQDLWRLKDAGYSEDAIFEITLCASVGAGLARLERGLRAVSGAEECD
jgi:alkylhydroperoxidase family enzyme